MRVCIYAVLSSICHSCHSQLVPGSVNGWGSYISHISYCVGMLSISINLFVLGFYGVHCTRGFISSERLLVIRTPFILVILKEWSFCLCVGTGASKY